MTKVSEFVEALVALIIGVVVLKVLIDVLSSL